MPALATREMAPLRAAPIVTARLEMPAACRQDEENDGGETGEGREGCVRYIARGRKEEQSFLPELVGRYVRAYAVFPRVIYTSVTWIVRWTDRRCRVYPCIGCGAASLSVAFV